MSRTRHDLPQREWWGPWAGLFHRDNREIRRRTLERRERAGERELELGLEELEADWYGCEDEPDERTIPVTTELAPGITATLYEAPEEDELDDLSCPCCGPEIESYECAVCGVSYLGADTAAECEAEHMSAILAELGEPTSRDQLERDLARVRMGLAVKHGIAESEVHELIAEHRYNHGGDELEEEYLEITSLLRGAA